MIPSQLLAGLKKLALLEDSTFQEFLAALKELQPKMYQRDISTGLRAAVRSLSEEDIKLITHTVFGLYLGQASTNLSKEEFLSIAIKDASANFSQSEKEQGTLKSRLTDILSVESLSIGAKAQSLFFEHERNLSEARVLTDVRPVFGAKPSEAPIAGIIIHQLKLNYLEGGKVREFYVSMDTKDILKLIEVLERAKEKQQTLKTVMQKTMRFIERD